MSTAERILTAINEHPGLKARQLAETLELTRREVNSIIYHELRREVHRDADFRWWPMDAAERYRREAAERKQWAKNDLPESAHPAKGRKKNKKYQKKKKSLPHESGRNDVVRLLKFSLQYHVENAFKDFPMFTTHEILAIYAISKSDRKKLLAARVAKLEPPVDHRSASQREKLRDIATDPSNR
jgi:hypothetical protein